MITITNHGQHLPTASDNGSEYKETNADLETAPTTDEEDNMLQSRRYKKKEGRH